MLADKVKDRAEGGCGGFGWGVGVKKKLYSCLADFGTFTCATVCSNRIHPMHYRVRGWYTMYT